MDKLKLISLSCFLLTLTVSFYACKNNDPKPEPTLPNGTFVSDPVTRSGGSTIHIYAKADTVTNITDSTVTLRSEITGLDEKYPIIEHGHIWSSTQNNPQIFTEGNFSKYGTMNAPTVFETDIDNWFAETKYYYRSYVKLRGDLIMYYPTVSEYTTGKIGLKYINIESPNYTNSSATGTILEINWNSNIESNVKIDLYKGDVFAKTIIENTQNTGKYTWVLSPELSEGTDYQIKISDISHFSTNDKSDKFRITKNPITLLTPTKSEIWAPGSTYSITWEDNISEQFKIELYKGLEAQQTIVAATNSDGEYSWSVENIDEDGSDYRIKLTHKNNENIYVLSDEFKIRTLENYAIEVTNPKDTSSWVLGTSYQIQWTDNIEGNVKIELFKGTELFLVVAADTPSDGSFQWIVDQSIEVGADYTLKITDVADSEITATSQIFLIRDLGDGSQVTDYEGNQYKTVKIGYQTWMAENLRSTKYANGTSLIDGTGAGSISNTDENKYYFYYGDNPSNNADYGKLYSWYSVVNGASSGTIQGICPTGWHLPSNTEWETLANYLGGVDVAGTKLKEESTSHWKFSNFPGSNISKFTGLPGGNRNQNGSFSGNLETTGYYWSSSEDTPSTVWVRALIYNEKTFQSIDFEKTKAFSVRCIKNEN